MNAAASTSGRAGNKVQPSVSLSASSLDLNDPKKKEKYYLPAQEKVKDFYNLKSIQIAVAILIFMNFVTAAANKQLLPEEGSAVAGTFEVFEYFYVYAFLIELLVNMYGHFWWTFWKDGWNWFDFIIVLVSLLAVYFPDLPAISVLRLFRAFRVVRLFKRVEEMRKIIEGIMRSLPSLSYAFVALGLIMGIWAIMGVDFFGEMTHTEANIPGYYFGNFFKSLLSLGQITTFDSWSSGIARDVIYEKGTGAALYFVTFVFFASIIMMNVLVALLLDNFLQQPTEEKSQSDKLYKQLWSYVANKDEVDLRAFTEYLSEKTFPDFIKNHYHPPIRGPKKKEEDCSLQKEIREKRKRCSLPGQQFVKDFYLRKSIQILVAILIFMNFITSAVEKQILPEHNSPEDRTFLAFEYFYVYAFLVELLINMYGHYFWEFWRSGWNWFDFVIVFISLVAVYMPDLPAISVLRLFRAFRVVRLFKRVKEMRKIIEGIMKSLPALSYAFVALGLITGIWAIMGVDFFGEMTHEDTFGRPIQGYFFGNFFRAFLSLGQITTFDSWSSGIARDIIYDKGPSAAMYFITFIFCAGIIMMNVLVALLLDNYLSPDPIEEDASMSPEDKMEQLASVIREHNINLEQFSHYLNHKAFPDFITYYHRPVEGKSNDNKDNAEGLPRGDTGLSVTF